MDIYSLTHAWLSNLPRVGDWPEMPALIRSAVDRRDPNWQLPAVACVAVGGTTSDAVPGVAAIGCAQISIILVDDMLDRDPRGEYNRIGEPAAANLASAFQAASLLSIARCELDWESRHAALSSLADMMWITAVGQRLDTQGLPDEAAYWRVVETKSAPFFSTAFHLGALLGGASPEVAEQFSQFGGVYGALIQIYDDLHDTMATPANPDWLANRSPLPILFAETVEHPERARFAELRDSILDPQALAEAQSILIRCGAVSYGVYELLSRHREAQRIVESMPLKSRSGIQALLSEIIEPVQALLAKMDTL